MSSGGGDRLDGMPEAARRLVEAIATYDHQAMGALLAPEAVGWLNLTEQDRSAEELLATMALEREHVAHAELDVQAAVATADGFVLRLVIDGATRAGTKFHIPVAVIVTVDGDRIARLDEYTDTEAVRPLLREMFSAGTRASGAPA